MVVVPRAPTPAIEQQEVFRPVAAPVDNYIRAPDPAPSPLHDLAGSLTNFSRDIRGMFQARDAKDAEDAEDAAIRGEAQFFQDNQVGYAEGVRTGKIPAFASKPFVAAYKEAEGKVIGARLASQMQLEYQTWSGRNSQDPANFDTFMADFLKRNLTKDDPDVLKGAMPFIYSTVNSGYAQRTQDAADATYNGGLNAGIAVNSMVVDDFSDSLGTDYDALWAKLIENRGSQLAVGTRAADYDTKLINMIASKALEARDPALLALLDKPLPGEAHPISASPYGREVKARTIDAMQTINSQANNAAYTAQTRRDKAMHDELTAFAVETIFKDPDAVLPDNFWAAYSKVEPEARVKIQELRNAATRGVQEDPELVSDLTYRILVEGEDPLTVLRAHGHELDGSTVQKLYEMSQETPVWQNSQAYRLGLKTIQAKANEGNSMSLNPEYVSPAASAASMDFELSMRAWAKTDAGKLAIANNDVAAMATQIGLVQGVIMGGFTSSGNAQATYAVPKAIATIRDAAGMPANPLAESQSAIDAADAAAAAFAASPQGQLKDWTAATPPDLNSLPPEVQQVIREEADKRGIDPQEILAETHREVNARLKKVDEGSAVDQGLQDVFDNAPTAQPQSYQTAPSDLPSSSGGTRPVVQDPALQAADFEPYYSQVRGKANLMSGNPTKYGTNSQTAEWQSANLANIKTPIGTTIQVHKEAARAFQGFLGDLAASGYQIKRVGGYNYRNKAEGSSLSEHAFGNAIDINWYEDGNGFSNDLVTNLPANVSQMAAKWGLSWGGDWHGKKDAMHFEWTGTNPPQLQHSGPFEVPPAGDPQSTAQGHPRQLLDFISQEEGTAGGDAYNTVYGGKIEDLTGMSLAEVAQRDIAAGKYQIRPETLGDAQQALGLSPDTKFTPQVQDDIAMWLLKRRGLTEWLNGDMPDAEFVDNLAHEWAALAGADGLPKYEGQGAGASLPRLIATLTTLKQ